MERFIITVARETGSGGHNVTRRLSEALGIPYALEGRIEA